MGIVMQWIDSDSDLFTQQPHPDKFLFHYTRSSALANILDSGEYWFSDARYTNDPRETREWVFGISRDTQEDELDLYAINKKFNRLLRGGFQLASFTMDNPDVASTPDNGVSFRGYGRARNWAQYGDNHKGACLVFDREKFALAVANSLPADLRPSLRQAQVSYKDEQGNILDNGKMLQLDEADLRNRGFEAVANEWRETYWETLFFRKSRDWESELEYRFVVKKDGDRLRVPIKDSLLAVVVGFDFPSTEGRVLQHRLDLSGFNSVVIAQITWPYGIPDYREYRPSG